MAFVGGGSNWMHLVMVNQLEIKTLAWNQNLLLENWEKWRFARKGVNKDIFSW